MAFKKINTLFILGLLTVAASVSVSLAAVYKVGDSVGWTSFGIVDAEHFIDYQRWATEKIFYVGDSLFFEYDTYFHDVQIVPRQAYEACDWTMPIATYHSGHDLITLDAPGHYYFMGGTPDFCLDGLQRFEIEVFLSPNQLSPSPLEASSSASSLSSNPRRMLESLCFSPTASVSLASRFSCSFITILLTILVEVVHVR